MRLRFLLAGLALVSVLEVDGAVAEAQVHIAQIRGARAAQVRRNLVRKLEEAGHSVVESEGDAALVVRGRVSRRAGRWRATLNLTDGGGADQGRVSASARGLPGLATQLARRLGRKLEAAAPTEEPESEPEPVASGGGMRVVVGAFRGRGASRVRGAVVQALSSERGVDLVPRAELESAGSDLDSEDGLMRAAGRARVSAYVVGTTARRGSRWTAEVTVRNGEDGEAVDSFTFRGRNLNALVSAIRRGGWEQLSGAIMRTDVPPEPEDDEEDEEDEEEDEEDEEEDEEDDEEDDDDDFGDGSDRRYNALDIAVLGHPFGRTLRYNDDLYGLLREYTLKFGPAIRLTGRWYPGAHATDGWGAHIGFDLMWERAFAIDSKRADGEVFPTRSQAWYVGLRGRIPFDRHEASVGVGYGAHSFVIDSAGPSQPGRLNIPQVPGVDYRTLAIQAETRLAPAGGFRVTLWGAYMILLDVGGIDTDIWFPRASAGAIEAGLLLGWETESGIEIRIGWDVRRYFYSFEPEVGDPFIVGGAVDQYFGYTFGLAYRL